MIKLIEMTIKTNEDEEVSSIKINYAQGSISRCPIVEGIYIHFYRKKTNSATVAEEQDTRQQNYKKEKKKKKCILISLRILRKKKKSAYFNRPNP